VTNPEFLQWRRSNRLLWGWIIAMLLEEVLVRVVDLKASTEMWLALQNIFAQVFKECEVSIFLQTSAFNIFTFN